MIPDLTPLDYTQFQPVRICAWQYGNYRIEQTGKREFWIFDGDCLIETKSRSYKKAVLRIWRNEMRLAENRRKAS